MKKRKWFPRLLLMLLISVVIGSSVYSWNALRLAGNAMPMPFGFGMSVVLSGSMEPTLSTGDLVLVRAGEDCAVGDVVVYQEGSSLVIHRVIALEEDEVLTQGDANNVPDDPVPHSRIKGKMIAALPGAGYVVQWIRSLPGVITVLALAFFLLYRGRQSERKADEAEVEALKQEILRLKIEQLKAEQQNEEQQNTNE